MVWEIAPDISLRVKFLVDNLNFTNIDANHVHCFRSNGSASRATARIWSLPKIWQQALKTTPGYCLEVISEKFDRLSLDQQEKVLIHELLHIPKTFSGSLVPHRTKKHRSFSHYHSQVESLFRNLIVKSYQKK